MAWPIGRSRPKQHRRSSGPRDPKLKLEMHTDKMALRHLSQLIDNDPALQEALIEKKFGIKINHPSGEEAQERAIAEKLLENSEYLQMIVDDRIAQMKASKAHSTLEERIDEEAIELFDSDPKLHKDLVDRRMRQLFRDGESGDELTDLLNRYETLQERFGGKKQNVIGGFLASPDVQSAVAAMILKLTGTQPIQTRQRTFVVLDEKGQLVEVSEQNFRRIAAQRAARQLEAPAAASDAAPDASADAPAAVAATPKLEDAVPQLDALLEHMEGPADDFAVLLVKESQDGNIFARWLANYLLDSTIEELKLMLQPFKAHSTWGKYITKAFENEQWFADVQVRVRALVKAKTESSDADDSPDNPVA